MPGQAEILYAFRAGGFFSGAEPPRDVPAGKGPRGELGRLPAVVRYVRDPAGDALTADVLFHSHLSHSAQELKRLLVAAEAWWRAIDLGYLADAPPLDTPLGQRAGLLLLLAGLLEFPADQNFVDGLWEMALDMLQLPRLSRSLIRRCNSDEDHDNGNYYGSVRGIRELVGTAEAPGGALKQANPEAYEDLAAADPAIGRARPLGEVAQAAGVKQLSAAIGLARPPGEVAQAAGCEAAERCDRPRPPARRGLAGGWGVNQMGAAIGRARPLGEVA
ncbi:hypothetical protein OV079_15455 [Nannocystis pusilla]|uniref:Uncharacterized protein n=1 Tax=Nannocystis pusilla TaxID=889268 RepID=A0A9X3IW36_9BACT|nr:hypothetical protein [Nannocystis pusilla]MCY1006927.1 hypothetical protein [Nannocystis pusilla]